MKKKVNKNSYPELDKFDRKQKKQTGSRTKKSKQKYSIYDDFEDDDFLYDKDDSEFSDLNE